MRHATHVTFAAAAVALALGGLGIQTAHGQGQTYPNYYFGTASAAYYDLGNTNDTDTYMTPNPFPPYHATPYGRPYDEQVYTSNSPYGYPPAVSHPYPNNTYPMPMFRSFPRGIFTEPTVPPADFHTYYADSPTLGYYWPGPFVYAHYGRMVRMAFRYGWW